MSKRIDCTLTDAQWRAVCDAFALYDVDREDADDERGRTTADRAFRKLRDGE